jgi:hypothetical protein
LRQRGTNTGHDDLRHRNLKRARQEQRDSPALDRAGGQLACPYRREIQRRKEHACRNILKLSVAGNP